MAREANAVWPALTAFVNLLPFPHCGHARPPSYLQDFVMSLSKRKGVRTSPQATPPRENRPLDRFHRQWQAIETLQAKLVKQEQEAAAIYQRFNDELAPLEQQQCECVFQFAQRLVGFTARKSFAQWQRNVLYDWIHELADYLVSHPLRGEIELEPLLAQLQANTVTHLNDDDLDAQCEFLQEMLHETVGQSPNDMETLREMARDPEKLREYMQAQLEGGQEAWEDEEDTHFADDPFAEGPYDDGGDAPDTSAVLDQLLDKSSLKQLYRKLAMQLHPDREQDPAKREEKSHIMAKLSLAWENKDMYTLLQLAHSHLPEVDNLLSEENLAVLLPMLTRKVHELEVRYHSGPEGIQGAVLRKFKQGSKRKTELAFEEHKRHLEQDIQGLKDKLVQITTLQSLKPYLAARWDARQNMVWAMEDELEDLFFR